MKKRDVQMRAETLSQVIEEAIALTRASVRDRGLRLTVETDPSVVRVEIDKIQVQQVLFNLLRNAIEAMQDQPKRQLVVATSLVQGGMVEISVADRVRVLSMKFERSCFSRLSRPRRTVWEWACPCAEPSWNRTAAGSGQTIIPAAARFSASPLDTSGSDGL